MMATRDSDIPTNKDPPPYKNIDCQSLQNQEGAFPGWLRKRGSTFKKWTRIFTVLYKGYVYIFKNENDTSQHSFFSLYGYESVIRALEIRDVVWAFKLKREDASRTRYFATSSEKEWNEWNFHFQEEIKYANRYSSTTETCKESSLNSSHQELESNIAPKPHQSAMLDRSSKSCSHLFEQGILPQRDFDTSVQSLPAKCEGGYQSQEDKQPLKGTPHFSEYASDSEDYDTVDDSSFSELSYSVIAINSYTSEEDDELSFQKDQKFKVTSQVTDQWLIGEIHGERGTFPARCVKRVHLNARDRENRPNARHRSSGSSVNSLQEYNNDQTSCENRPNSRHRSSGSSVNSIQGYNNDQTSCVLFPSPEEQTENSNLEQEIHNRKGYVANSPKPKRTDSYHKKIGFSLKSKNKRTSSDHLSHVFGDNRKNSFDKFKQCSGVEKSKKIRIIVVGPKGSGKTCLTRRLLRKGIENVESTSGVDIHILNCKAKLEDSKWTCDEDWSLKDDINSRILNALIKTNESTEEKNENDKWEPTYMNFNIKEQKTTVEHHVPEKHVDQTQADTIDEIDDMQDILDAHLDEVETASIDFWDFAGDREFYNTHKVFLSTEAIYIVTVNIFESTQERKLDDSIYDLKFWLDTIRCYSRNIDQNESEAEPTVFIVGTHKDKFTGSSLEYKAKFHADVYATTDESSRKQLKELYTISNTEDEDEEFDKLRTDILRTAQNMPTWNKELPIRWIYLEKALLDEICSNQFILSIHQVRTLAANTSLPITDPNEIESFLLYHHDIGTYVYFKECPEYVVLYPQWLADAFKCIVSADKFQVKMLTINEWDQFRKTGRLTENLLDHLFSHQPSEIRENRDFVLKVMEKFDIIVRPQVMLENRKEVIQEPDYRVPCMIRTKHINDIAPHFKFDCKSSWLCFEFDFLPPPLVTCLLVEYSHAQAVASFPNSTCVSDPIFYRDFALFHRRNVNDEMLLIAAYKRVIEVQVWRWSTQNRSYCLIRQELDYLIQTLSNRYRMKISYKTKVRCGELKFDDLNEMKDIEFLDKGLQYICPCNGKLHSTDEICSDWIREEARQMFNKEQINAIRMSMITLGVLTDILFDLVIDGSVRVRSRTECDITYLYAQLRRQNKHIPSNGWGGILANINDSQKKIGDDIERVRLIRNEIKHLPTFEISNNRFFEIRILVQKLAKRMGNVNSKGSQYSRSINDVLVADLSYREENLQTKITFEAPRLCIKEKSYTVQIGEGCTLECDVLIPIPNDAVIEWYKRVGENDTKIDLTGQKYEGATTEYPSLVIRKVEKSDACFYSCKIIYPTNSAEYYDTNIIWPSTFLHVNPVK